jgi:hypothetical protein
MRSPLPLFSCGPPWTGATWRIVADDDESPKLPAASSIGGSTDWTVSLDAEPQASHLDLGEPIAASADDPPITQFAGAVRP